MTDVPMTRPGEIAGRPKLVLRYPTDAGAVAALLPPGLETVGEPVVQIGIYCVPVYGEPEYGVSTKVAARYGGVDGQYCLGIGIDQEAAIFISRETNGQPKFPCSVRYFRLGDEVHATCTHQGHTFLTFDGAVTGEASGDAARARSSPTTSGGSRSPAPSVGWKAPTTSRPTSCRSTAKASSPTSNLLPVTSCWPTARGTPTPSCCR